MLYYIMLYHSMHAQTSLQPPITHPPDKLINLPLLSLSSILCSFPLVFLPCLALCSIFFAPLNHTYCYKCNSNLTTNTKTTESTSNKIYNNYQYHVHLTSHSIFHIFHSCPDLCFAPELSLCPCSLGVHFVLAPLTQQLQ